MNILLFDGPEREHFLPFTFIRPVAHLRVGIDRLIDKWEAYLQCKCGLYTQDYLQSKFPTHLHEINLFVNPAFLPIESLATAVKNLTVNEALIHEGHLIAVLTKDQHPPISLDGYDLNIWNDPILHMQKVSDLFTLNEVVLKQDFDRITNGRQSEELSPSNSVINRENIFVEKGAKVECSTLNATEGPIYIGKNALIMEGSMLRGSIALCESVIVKMGAKIYGGTTLGPFSKVGGELSNVLIFGYSNKGHDGYLGNAILGEWCNIGAASDASNLKNSYGKIRLWNYTRESFIKTDLQFCGLLMGDYSRCSIHTTFNTATVIGISANIFGQGFPRNFIPSFSYGGAQGFKTYNFSKAIESIENMMDRKSISLSIDDQAILTYIFDQSSKFRKA